MSGDADFGLTSYLSLSPVELHTRMDLTWKYQKDSC